MLRTSGRGRFPAIAPARVAPLHARGLGRRAEGPESQFHPPGWPRAGGEFTSRFRRVSRIVPEMRLAY